MKIRGWIDEKEIRSAHPPKEHSMSSTLLDLRKSLWEREVRCICIGSCTVLVLLHAGRCIVWSVYQSVHHLNKTMKFRVNRYYLEYLRSHILPLGCLLMR